MRETFSPLTCLAQKKAKIKPWVYEYLWHKNERSIFSLNMFCLKKELELNTHKMNIEYP